MGRLNHQEKGISSQVGNRSAGLRTHRPPRFNVTAVVLQIFFVLLPYLFQMIPEPGFGGGKDRDAVPVPLSSPHGDLSISEVDVLQRMRSGIGKRNPVRQTEPSVGP